MRKTVGSLVEFVCLVLATDKHIQLLDSEHDRVIILSKRRRLVTAERRP